MNTHVLLTSLTGTCDVLYLAHKARSLNLDGAGAEQGGENERLTKISPLRIRVLFNGQHPRTKYPLSLLVGF